MVFVHDTKRRAGVGQGEVKYSGERSYRDKGLRRVEMVITFYKW